MFGQKPAPDDSGKTNTVSGKATGQCATLAGGGGGGLGAPPPLPQDQSNTLPNLNYGEAVGDFTGVGHDQRAYAQDGDLKIADVDKSGNPVHSVGTDLMATPNDGLEGLVVALFQTVSVWQRDEETNAGAAFNLTGVKVAASSHIFMAGATWGPGRRACHLPAAPLRAAAQRFLRVRLLRREDGRPAPHVHL